MALPIYQVDAFAESVFKGNPAAVMPLERWLDDQLLSDIAMENNLPETAYLVKVGNGYELRWAPSPVKRWLPMGQRARCCTSTSSRRT